MVRRGGLLVGGGNGDVGWRLVLHVDSLDVGRLFHVSVISKVCVC